jgi:hypothetical protein
VGRARDRKLQRRSGIKRHIARDLSRCLPGWGKRRAFQSESPIDYSADGQSASLYISEIREETAVDRCRAAGLKY